MFNESPRLGELVVKSKGLANMVIQQDDIKFDFKYTHSLNTVVIVMRHFKTTIHCTVYFTVVLLLIILQRLEYYQGRS